MSWRDSAACKGVDAEVFFGTEKGWSSNQAKAICDTCPVTVECLDYALEQSINVGIWGGLANRERRQVRNQRGGIPRECQYCGAEYVYQFGQRRYCTDACQRAAHNLAEREARARWGAARMLRNVRDPL